MPQAPEFIEFVLRMGKQVAAEQVQEEISGKIKEESRIDPEYRGIEDVGVNAFLQELMKREYRK